MTGLFVEHKLDCSNINTSHLEGWETSYGATMEIHVRVDTTIAFIDFPVQFFFAKFLTGTVMRIHGPAFDYLTKIRVDKL